MKPHGLALRVLVVVAALSLGALASPAAPAQTSQPSPPSTPPPVTVSVTLARGIQSTSLFGSGEVAPVNATTTFVTTDVPWAVVKVKAMLPDTKVTLRVVDPTGSAYSVDAKTPQHTNNAPWEAFDFAAPLYILGTDLEGHTGTWHLQILFNGQVQNDTGFQWQPATRLALPKVKEVVDESPTKPDLHWRYGAALALFGHDREAVQELQNAIRLDPRYALYHITLGRIYERQGRQADAVSEFQTALTLHGSYYDAVFSGWARAHLTRLQAH